jgi:hypothetical protein
MLALILTFGICSLNAQVIETPTTTSLPSWIEKNWSFVALILSESLAFVPSKAKGITQAIINIAAGLFKKK